MSYCTRDEDDSGHSGDEALVARAQDRDNDAFEVLVKRYEKRLFNYIFRFIGNAGDAEDLFQETFVRVYRNLDKFRTGGTFRPWLYRIATNICRDHLRSQRRHPKISLDAPQSGETEGPRLLDQLESPSPGPRALASEHELIERLEAALEKLPTKHRSVFLMARYEGLNHREISKALRIPVGTVKSRMNKAVKSLRHELVETEK